MRIKKRRKKSSFTAAERARFPSLAEGIAHLDKIADEHPEFAGREPPPWVIETSHPDIPPWPSGIPAFPLLT